MINYDRSLIIAIK